MLFYCYYISDSSSYFFSKTFFQLNLFLERILIVAISSHVIIHVSHGEKAIVWCCIRIAWMLEKANGPVYQQCTRTGHASNCSLKERKGKERKWTCIAPIASISITKRSDVDHTVTCKYTTSAFPSYKYSVEGETAVNSLFHLANRYTTHFPSH